MSDARKRSLTSEQWDELRKRRPSHSSTSSAKASSEARAHAQGQTEEVRTPFQKDLDRLLYNYYTRRLARVTQVTTVANRSANETDIAHHIPHNRLTHSLKVGQVARPTTSTMESTQTGTSEASKRQVESTSMSPSLLDELTISATLLLDTLAKKC